MYSAWFGKPVVLLVVVRQCHVPMPCNIVGESAADVRVRIQPGWEMDVRKELILAVEEDAVATDCPRELTRPMASIVSLPSRRVIEPTCGGKFQRSVYNRAKN